MFEPEYAQPELDQGTALVYRGVWYRKMGGLHFVRLATGAEVTFCSANGAKAYIDHLLDKEMVA